MRPVRTHAPGPAVTPDPPEKLVAATDALRHPLVQECGLTTTTDGRWAVFVTVPKDATVPIPAVESQAAGFPVVYEAAPTEPAKAGPAYPKGRK